MVKPTANKPLLKTTNNANKSINLTNKSMTGTHSKKFALAASLAKPLNYKPQTGKLKVWEIKKKDISNKMRGIKHNEENNVFNIKCGHLEGPNILSDTYRILLRFRNRKYAILTDANKASNGLRTGIVEKHLLLVVFRRTTIENGKTSGILCVSFNYVPHISLNNRHLSSNRVFLNTALYHFTLQFGIHGRHKFAGRNSSMKRCYQEAADSLAEGSS